VHASPSRVGDGVGGMVGARVGVSGLGVGDGAVGVLGVPVQTRLSQAASAQTHCIPGGQSVPPVQLSPVGYDVGAGAGGVGKGVQ